MDSLDHDSKDLGVSLIGPERSSVCRFYTHPATDAHEWASLVSLVLWVLLGIFATVGSNKLGTKLREKFDVRLTNTSFP
jgi:hypothetical protein